MEELRTTEILEREILDDARKKADRFLRNAEAGIASLKKDQAERLSRTFAELEERYVKRLSDAQKEIESSLPLEIKRRTITYYDRILGEELDRYFAGFDSRRVARSVRLFLERSKHLFAGKPLILRYGGMPQEEAEQLVSSVCTGSTFERIEASGSLRGVVLERADGTMRLTATLELIRQILLDEKREELYSSLFEGKD